MVWPPRSPDMIPIVLLWDVVGRSIRTQNPVPTNTRELRTAVQSTWLNISLEVFRPLLDSMPLQVAALRRARGGPYTILGAYPVTFGTSVLICRLCLFLRGNIYGGPRPITGIAVPLLLYKVQIISMQNEG
jgi:hypothetical protein